MKRLFVIFLMLLITTFAYGHGIGPGLVNVQEPDGAPNEWVKAVKFTNGTVAVTDGVATVTISGVSPGSGSMTTVKSGNATVGDADIVVLDFLSGFLTQEAGDTEINVSINPTPDTGFATIELGTSTGSGKAGSVEVKYDSTDFTEGANGLYLGASPTMTGSPVIGTALLADAQDGAVLGSATLQFSDLFLADGGTVTMGDDSDVVITHSADTGVIVSVAGATNNEDFNLDLETNANTWTLSSSTGVNITRLIADDVTVLLDSTDAQDSDWWIIVDADQGASANDPLEIGNNATVGTSPAISIASTMIVTLADDLIIKDAGTIGSASAPTAMGISSGGIVTFVDDILIKDAGTIGSASATTAIGIASTGIVTFVDDILIKDAGTIGSASSTSAISIASTGIVTFVDDILIKDAGTIGSASDTDAISISSAGIVDVSNTTEASAIGTAALTTGGGLGVAKDVWVGDDLVLDSDSVVLDFGADQDVTVTHVADTGLTMASAAPDFTLTDETAGDGTGNLLFASGTAAADIVATLQVDVSNTAVTYLTLDGTNERVTIGPTPDDNNVPFGVQGDADSDAGGDTSDILAITLTGNATPTSATWGFTSTQSAGYTFDKAVSPSASDGAALGTTALQWSDIYIADAGKIDLGDDQDVTITHVPDAGILMELDDYISFGDSAVFIESDDDGYLDLDADTGIRLNAATTVAAAGITITPADASPGSDGRIVIDSTVTGLDDGAIAYYEGGDTVYYVAAFPVLPVTDNHVLSYDSGSDRLVWQADADSGGAPTLDSVVSPEGTWDPVMQDTEIITMTFEETDADPMIFLADGTFADISIVTITQSGNATDGVLLELYTSDDDVDHLMLATDDSDSVTHKLATTGTYTIDITTDGTALVDIVDPLTAGSLTSDAGLLIADAGSIGSASDTNAITISAAGVIDVTNTAEASAIGTAALTVDGGVGVAFDVWIGDDLTLDSDSTLINLGADQDVVITHVADTGINITTTAATSGTINLGNDDDANDDSIDLILHDSGTIQLYDANDDTSATLSVADGASALTLSGGIAIAAAGVAFTPADASPTADGQMVMDSAVAGLDDGAFAYYEGGDTVYYLVAMAEIPDDADDDKVIAYDKDTDRYYMAAGGGDVLADGSVPFTGDVEINSATPALTFTDTDSADGTATLAFQATGSNEVVASIQTDVAGTLTTYLQLDGVTATVDVIPDLAIGANPADAGTGIRMSNNSVIEFEDSENTGEVTALQVDAAELISIGDANASGLTLVPATSVTGTLTADAMLTASVGITTTDVGLILSSAAALDQSANNVVELTENSDSIQFAFDATDLGIVWSDGALNLDTAEDADSIVNITGGGATRKGDLRLRSAGGDKYTGIYHDDTDAWVVASSGDLTLAPDGDVDDFVAISTATDVTSISVPGSTGTLGTAAAEWDAIYLNDSGVIYGENDQANTITSSATAWTFNQAIAATDATFTGTTTVADLAMSGVAQPQFSFQDSGADGADSADEEAAKIIANMTTETEDAEVSDLWFTNMQAGSTTTVMLFDGSANSIEAENIINAEAGITVSNGITTAGFIDLYEDEDSVNDYKIRISVPSVADGGITEGGDMDFVLPPNEGDNTNILATTGDGKTYWTSAGAATAWHNIGDSGADQTIAMAGYNSVFTNSATGPTGDHMFSFEASGAFADDSVVNIEQTNTGATDGELLSLTLVDTEANVDQLAIFNGTDESELTRLIDAGSITRTLVSSDGFAQWLFSTVEDGTDATDTDGIYEIITNATMDADQDIFNVVKGTDTLFSVDEDGDVDADGTVTAGEFSGGGASLTAVDAATGDSATAFFDAGTVEVSYGGTGAATLALNGVLYGNGTSAVGATAIGSAGDILVAGADPFVPVFVTMGTDATIDATGALTIADSVSVETWTLGGGTAFGNDGLTGVGSIAGASTIAMTSTLTGATGITLGSATTDAASDFTMIMGNQTDDPQFVIAMSDDANGDVTMTTTNGDDADISIVSTDDIMLDPGGDVINFVSTTETMTLTNGSNLWTFDSAGDTFVFADAVAVTTAAGFIIGVEDSVNGHLHMYGDTGSSTAGAILDMHTAADHDGSIQYYRTQVYEDDVYFGNNTDSDIMTIIAGTALNITVATDVAAALSANSLTLDNGGTITFTDGASDTITHTDDTGIAIVSGSGTVTVESVVFTTGAITGATSITAGAAEINGTITLENDETISNATDGIINMAGGVQREGPAASATDGYYDGDVRTFTVDSGATSVFGQALHVDTDGELIVADGDVASQGAMPAIGLAVEAGTGSKKILLRGLICETDWAWTVGGTVYVSDDATTTEGLTQTAISTTGDTVQVVGIATHADCIEVNMGGYVWVEVP